MIFYRNKYTLLLIFAIFLSGCKKFDKEEAIPSYIRIKSCVLSCDSISQGSTRHKITDVWVNIDGIRQGTYELPVTFPVLYEGNHSIQLRAGIKVNGIGASRLPYPFLSILTIDTVLTKDHILELTPVYTYHPSTQFEWKEDFENNGFTLDRMTDSDTTLVVHSDSLYPLQHYAEFHIDTARKTFQYESTDVFDNYGTNVFLELDYQCDYPIVIGLVLNKYQQSVVTPLIVLNSHPNSFNHIYIDLGSTLIQNTDAADFSIFIGATLSDGDNSGSGKIDNIKLLHF